MPNTEMINKKLHPTFFDSLSHSLFSLFLSSLLFSIKDFLLVIPITILLYVRRRTLSMSIRPTRSIHVLGSTFTILSMYVFYMQDNLFLGMTEAGFENEHK
jgi:hypothetical protein